MSTRKKVGILGAGALGACYATQFIETDNIDPFFIARNNRYTRLKNDGVIVNNTRYDIPVYHPDDSGEPCDLIIVSLKDRHLPDAIGDLKNFCGDNTSIISVMNGLDSETILAEEYGTDRVLYAISVGIDAVRQNNSVTYSRVGKIIFGERDNSILTERVKSICQILDSANICYDTPIDMIRTIWWKFMINVGINQASAVLQANYGVFHQLKEAKTLMEDLMREVIALAEKKGVNLHDEDIDNWYNFLNTLSPDGKTSMLQDIEANRKSEVGIFAGKVISLGKELGIETPVNQTILNIITVLERSAI